jgi:hypothetical protein
MFPVDLGCRGSALCLVVRLVVSLRKATRFLGPVSLGTNTDQTLSDLSSNREHSLKGGRTDC